jgi:hypothetical protein
MCFASCFIIILLRKLFPLAAEMGLPETLERQPPFISPLLYYRRLNSFEILEYMHSLAQTGDLVMLIV